MNDKAIKNIICGGKHTMMYRDNGDFLFLDITTVDNQG